jgi:hypothetical protein
MSRLPGIPLLILSLLILLFSTAPAHAGASFLFDQGHGQLFFIDRDKELDLSALAGTFRGLGHDVATTSSPISDKTLGGVDVLFISGSFKPFSPEEIDAVARFVERGGAVCITLHIGPPLSSLLSRFGVEHSNGVINEEEGIIEGDPLKFSVNRLEKHPIFEGLKQFSLYGVWALNNVWPDAHVIAQTSPTAWIDLNRNGKFDATDARQSFAVTIAGEMGNGRFVVFGDDAVFQNKFLKGDNLVLAKNLTAWLAGSKRGAPSSNSTP